VAHGNRLRRNVNSRLEQVTYLPLEAPGVSAGKASAGPSKLLAAKRIISDYLEGRGWKIWAVESTRYRGLWMPSGWVDVVAKKGRKRIGVEVELGSYRYVGFSSSRSNARGGLVFRLRVQSWMFDEIWLAFERGCRLSGEIPKAIDACAIRLFAVDFAKRKLFSARLISANGADFTVST